MPVNFGEAAKRHWNDALLLQEVKRLANADQLYGLSAECALKEIMVHWGATVNPEGDFADKKNWKHMKELWDEFQMFAAGRRGARGLSALAKFGTNPFSDWQLGQRYLRDSDSPSENVVIAHRKACAACHLALQRSLGGTNT
jgi:hypothetical protein